ncbi:MAG: SpoIIE family protein phosphatase [Desulfobacteraceae bacterium]|jgi:hypothetical protein
MEKSQSEIHDPGRYVIEVDHYQKFKHDQQVGGDTFYSIRLQDENRTISILSDGLGSGIKASVLSTLTAVMAARFTAGYRDVKHTSELIMRTLPVCSQRKISYATFTIIDIDGRGTARIIEYDNPPAVIIRDNEVLLLEPALIEGKVGSGRPYRLYYYQFPIRYGDRIICFSDGVSQSGIGLKSFPLGWGKVRVTELVLEYIRHNPFISARDLSKSIVMQAFHNDADHALDDITCGVVYYRKPRELMVVTGPPFDRQKDAEVASMLDRHNGLKIVCGGSTANMIARELDREISLDLHNLKPGIPPSSSIEGIDLVTEGILTLRRAADLLKEKRRDDDGISTPAHQVVEMMLDSDIIIFVVGTRINDAYQDPCIPEEIALRRSLVREIMENLENIHMKETKLMLV